MAKDKVEKKTKKTLKKKNVIKKNKKTTNKSVKKAKQDKKKSKSKKNIIKEQPTYVESIFSSFHSDELPTHEPIIEKNKKKEPIIVLLYADWCGHCQRLKPTWEKTKGELIESNMLNDENFYEIESAIIDEELPKLNNYVEIGEPVMVQGYPTIGKIEGKKYMQFTGDRDEDRLRAFMGGK